jgi:hypothetical protein
LPFLAPAIAVVVLWSNAVAGTRLRCATFLLEEFLLLAVTTRAIFGWTTTLLSRLLRLRSLHLRRRRLSLIWLQLSLRLAGWLVGLVFATTPAAPMSLRLSLACGRGRPQLGLGHRRFCCHACTSWHIAVACISLLLQLLHP